MTPRALLLAAALATATPATATIRALFVGIDNYAVRPGDPEPPAQLHGPVNDVAIIKAALARHYGLDVGPAPAADCVPPPATAITLINQCATRDAMLAALDGQIAAATSGDLLIFYYAGHGSFVANTERSAGQDKRNSTLLPHDARAGSPRDIYDVELRDRLYTANAKGVSVVTIFDSCSSGTATRDLRVGTAARDAAAITTAPAADAGSVIPAPVAGAYLVHFAAVADDGIAVETRFAADDGLAPVAQVDGVFTRALALALAQDPGRSTYRDIAERTRRLMALLGAAPPPLLDSKFPGPPPRGARLAAALSGAAATRLAAQAAQAEGALDSAFLGSAAPPARVYPAVATGGQTLATRQDGRLSGLTAGSRFAVHCSLADAGAARGVVAGTAVVTGVTATTAQLQLAAPLAGCAAGDALAIRETRHSYGDLKLRLGAQGTNDAEAAKFAAALAGADALIRDDTNAAYFLSVETAADRCDPASGPRTAAFRAADNRLILCLGAPDGALFERRLGEIVRAAANYHAVVGLAEERTAELATITLRPPDCEKVACSFVTGSHNRVSSGSGLAVYVTATTTPVHAYALLLDGRNFRVQPLNGADNQDGTRIEPGSSGRQLFAGTFGAPGELGLLVLIAPTPISLAALRQQPVRDAGSRRLSALERLLTRAGQGRRDTPTATPEAWEARLTRFTIGANP
ncbi:hypothetical protein IP88_02025 [alpha proteobacterium AAP81b]|nr:hypothetical protein IP88_02025 [alpha proteobacterium AAP81b]